ncbi:hypothetical protein [Candidatus Protochlamydia phocaeensis]|uniref:hypothetical protein n=1 Tax=Candidatus Protochlamydia phocaeensis TaxID=1414722 RepID=UPI0012AC474A|nr:hypothetical protein [Candidatus Protochlamydia phocaeensis]
MIQKLQGKGSVHKFNGGCSFNACRLDWMALASSLTALFMILFGVDWPFDRLYFNYLFGDPAERLPGLGHPAIQ